MYVKSSIAGQSWLLIFKSTEINIDDIVFFASMLEPIIVSDKSHGPYIRYSEYVMGFLDMYKSISYKYMQWQSTYIVYRDKFGWFTTFYDMYFILWIRKHLKLVF